jgi:glutathione peroxidase
MFKQRLLRPNAGAVRFQGGAHNHDCDEAIEMPAMTTAYDFQLHALDGSPLPLSIFAGRPMVIVNTASKCGMTPQYEGLQALWAEFGPARLVVLGVPSNDFGNQEPGDAAAIAAFCTETYRVGFPLASKIHVRGAQADPLFKWLAETGGFFARPRWNFYKYLIGKDGLLKDWFASTTPPQSVRFRRAVEALVKP